MSPVWARCMLVSDTDERALLSKARPRGPSRWSQSPERKMSMNLGQTAILLPKLTSAASEKLYSKTLLDKLGRAPGRRCRFRKGLVALPGSPQVVQQDRQLAGHRHHRPFFGSFPSLG